MKQSISFTLIGILLIFSACGKYEDQMNTPTLNEDNKNVITNDKTAISDSLKISLKWDSNSDLDLYAQDPMGEWIWYKHKKSQSNGKLEFDYRNGKATEKIYWAANQAPKGLYKACIRHNGGETSKFTIIIQTHGKTRLYEGSIKSGATIYVSEFNDQLKETLSKEMQIDQLPTMNKN